LEVGDRREEDRFRREEDRCRREEVLNRIQGEGNILHRYRK
jgi:hypothetical protein